MRAVLFSAVYWAASVVIIIILIIIIIIIILLVFPRMGAGRDAYSVFVRKCEGKRTFGSPRLWWQDNIEMYFTEIIWEAWDGLMRLRIVSNWRPFVKAVKNIRIPWNEGISCLPEELLWFQALATVEMRSSLFWYFTRRRLVISYRCFGAIYGTVMLSRNVGS